MPRRPAAPLLLLLPGVALAAAPQPPAVEARAWLLLDATSGQSIASRNPKERIEPASLTKLMTAYLAFAALKDGSLALGQTIRVSERAWHAAGSRMFIEPRKPDRKSTRLNSSHSQISYAVFCLKKKKTR